HLESLILKLEEMNVHMDIKADSITVYGDHELNATDIKTLPYPGFATDLQQPLSALLTKCKGQSRIIETIYTERFRHCNELNRMGADIDLLPATAIINGPSELSGCDVKATDLRGGASVVIAGLIANGNTIIHDIYHIDRGYDDIVGKLVNLGAKISRQVKDND
ncbi:MAG: UDP-N-acetylglucosamine 1-carboxyvinyltransferase, partial [Erysipelotrichaceae bacterium]